MKNDKQTEAYENEKDAFELLMADHAEVKKSFKQYKKLLDNDSDADERKELADEICQALTVHAQIEEELFYPALRNALDEADLVDEAAVEHATIKDLIKQIKSSAPDKPLFDAKITVLKEYVEHHVKEEEEQIFPKARKAKLDIAALGQELASRKSQLMNPGQKGKGSMEKPRHAH